MTFREKRRQHEREMRWLVNISLHPVMAFMVTIPVLALVGANEWWWKLAMDHFVEGLMVSFVIVVAHAWGIRIHPLEWVIRLKQRVEILFLLP